MPSLRERIDDLPELIAEFNARLRGRGLMPAAFGVCALRAMAAYDWPGNVRELANLGERMAIMAPATPRSEEHTSELQSLMRISYAVFCLKKKKTTRQTT